MRTQTLPPQRKAEIWAGSRLPVDLLLEPAQDLMVDFWVESSTGIVRQCEVVPEGSPLEAFAGRLESAISQPMSGMRAYRPGGIMVDRKELAEAIAPLCAQLGIEVQVRPEVAERLKELVVKLERDLGGGPGFGYLVSDDIEPELVGEMFERAARLLDQQPWSLIPAPSMLEISGLLHKPVYVSVLGAHRDVELVLHMNPEDADAFASGPDNARSVPGLHLSLFPAGRARPGLKAEMEEHGWKEHELGVPLLLSGFRPDNSSPTALELKIMNLVLEAADFFGQDPSRDTVTLWQGTEVRLRLVQSIEPEALHSGALDASDVLLTLDQLWEEGKLDEALEIGALFLRDAENMKSPIAYRFPLYLSAKGDLEFANQFWQAQLSGCDPEWYYLGAFLDLRRGHTSSAQKRLKKGTKHDPEVGYRLLGQREDDDYSRLWRPVWQSHSQGLKMLQDVLAPESKPTAGKSSRRSGKKKK